MKEGLVFPPVVPGPYQSRSIYLSAFSGHLLNVRPRDFQMGDIVISSCSQMYFSASSLRSTAQRAREGDVLWNPRGLHRGTLRRARIAGPLRGASHTGCA